MNDMEQICDSWLRVNLETRVRIFKDAGVCVVIQYRNGKKRKVHLAIDELKQILVEFETAAK